MSQKLSCHTAPQFHSELLANGLISRELVKDLKYIEFQEARRRKYPIYQVLLNELYEEGCIEAAKYFRFLMEKESRLMGMNLISGTLRNLYPMLLLRLVENVKKAEIQSVVDATNGGLHCLQLLYETLRLLEEYEHDLHWLLNDVYWIVVDITETILKFRCNFRCTPIIAKVYCKFAVFLTRQECNLPLAVEYFRKTLDLCRGELWSAEDLSRDILTLHDYTSAQLAKTLLAYTKLPSVTPAFGMQLTRKALASLVEVNYTKFPILYGDIMLVKIQYLMDNQEYQSAMADIGLLQRHLLSIEYGIDYVRLTCEVFLKKGSCYNLMQQQHKSLMKFKQCRLLASKYDLKNLEGSALLHLGELYEKYSSKRGEARESYEQAKQNFCGTANWKMKQICMYALARLQAREYFPHLIRTFKSTLHDRCALLRLYRWKNRLIPLRRYQTANHSYFIGHDDLPECDYVSGADKDDKSEVELKDSVSEAGFLGTEDMEERRITII